MKRNRFSQMLDKKKRLSGMVVKKRTGRRMFWYWLFWQCDGTAKLYVDQLEKLGIL